MHTWLRTLHRGCHTLLTHTLTVWCMPLHTMAWWLQGQHLGGGWHPDRQEQQPFAQPDWLQFKRYGQPQQQQHHGQQQQFNYHQQQQSYHHQQQQQEQQEQHFQQGQQQHFQQRQRHQQQDQGVQQQHELLQQHRRQQQQWQRQQPTRQPPQQQQEQLNMTVQLMQQQIQSLQKELDAMPFGPERSERSKELRDMLKQLLVLQQTPIPQPAPYNSSRALGAAAAADISIMMGQDPLDALMEPCISSNVAFRAAVGSRLSNNSSSTAAHLMGYCTYVLQEKLEEVLPHALQQVVQQSGMALGNASSAGSTVRAKAGSAAPGSNCSRAAAPQQAGKAGQSAPVPREVPLLKDQKSLHDMIKWYTQVMSW